MRLYVKQKVFSWLDRFSIKDEYEQDRYYVQGEFSFGKKLHIYDRNNREVAFLQQKLWSFLPKFEVIINGRVVAEIIKEFTFLKPRYTINGPRWTVEGSFGEHDYCIHGKEGTLAEVHKAWLSWGDSYEISLQEGEDEAMILAVILAIDAVMEEEAVAASAASSS